jgi:hypothetical protein
MDVGKIYKISGYGLNYYGSTTESIKRRLARHKNHYKDYLDNKRNDKISVFDIFKLGDDYNIELVEHIVCDNKNELLDRENYYITNNECVNICVPNRTQEQLKERQKKYNENHKEQIKKTAKEWAEKKRREEGKQIKSEMNKSKTPEYSVEKTRKYRAKMTPEQKEELLIKRREQYKLKPQTEEQKEKARERARLQRERNKNNTNK